MKLNSTGPAGRDGHRSERQSPAVRGPGRREAIVAPGGSFLAPLSSGRLARVCLALVAAAAASLLWSLVDPLAIALAQEEGAAPKTLMDNLKAGGAIGFVIILCSVVGLSLSITYAFQIRRDVLVPPELLAQVEQLFEDEDYEEAFHVCEANPCFISSVLTAGLSKLDAGWEEVEKAMQEAGEMETTRLSQKVGYISLIAAISPMLGLFGTVSGMIATFNVIASSPVQPKPAQLAGGISEALVTTYLGLVVAIPMTVIYAIFRNRVTAVVMEVGGITEELMGRFKAPAAT